MWKTFAANPERALTEEEKLAFKEAFDVFDKDGDGCLDDRELKKILEGPINYF